MIDPNTRARFWSKVNKSAPGGCWQWLGSLVTSGYGTIWVSATRKTERAHRVSILIDGRDIPDGKVVDHECMNRGCVNPEHLRVVTPRINAIENSGSSAAKNAAKTHCVNGHLFGGENLIIINGSRVCKECKAERDRKYRVNRFGTKDWTRCKNGHLLEGDNLYIAKKQRVCRECQRASNRKYMKEKRKRMRQASEFARAAAKED